MSGLPVALDVSRETLEKLRAYEALVRKWNSKINLVAQGTLDDFSSRHIQDSIAIARATAMHGQWLDLGSGGGLPGIVVAILADPERSVTLIESDGRKAAFLNTVRRELGLDLRVIPDRIEDVDPFAADVVSARALAPLPRLLELCVRHGHPRTRYILPKGRNWRQEVMEAEASWVYDVEIIESPVDPSSVILKITNLDRA
ncbi:16S rRNA (guanine(527)-N(7))-methyltransferase RsmG [Jannaschia pohangensis]|uniref:Ribosomal RNA small subunit methyltransferase G n=1 Tax=Jannaschia pohangensis TaxID=390807 RepID=A0A1I3TFD2_9RHOB|nr:16S rRNA (guanine(527)-N(7))-methyltransferase RsmG [Jannaschia pohangensis]SFJ69222.1 16S rRNA m(7)G-527 methyltransferase [Jannaschia pohangensis]